MFGSALSGADFGRPDRTAMFSSTCPSARAEHRRRGAECVDVRSSAACVLRVRCALDRIQLDDRRIVGVVALKVDAAARLEATTHDARHLFQPRAEVGLDRRRFLVCEYPVDPIVDSGRAPRRVDHRIPLGEVPAGQLRQVGFKWTSHEVVERFDDLLGMRQSTPRTSWSVCASSARLGTSGTADRDILEELTRSPARPPIDMACNALLEYEAGLLEDLGVQALRVIDHDDDRSAVGSAGGRCSARRRSCSRRSHSSAARDSPLVAAPISCALRSSSPRSS